MKRWLFTHLSQRSGPSLRIFLVVCLAVLKGLRHAPKLLLLLPMSLTPVSRKAARDKVQRASAIAGGFPAEDGGLLIYQADDNCCAHRGYRYPISFVV